MRRFVNKICYYIIWLTTWGQWNTSLIHQRTWRKNGPHPQIRSKGGEQCNAIQLYHLNSFMKIVLLVIVQGIDIHSTEFKLHAAKLKLWPDSIYFYHSNRHLDCHQNIVGVSHFGGNNSCAIWIRASPFKMNWEVSGEQVSSQCHGNQALKA